jgi:hypothetical protein
VKTSPPLSCAHKFCPAAQLFAFFLSSVNLAPFFDCDPPAAAAVLSSAFSSIAKKRALKQRARGELIGQLDLLV